MALLRFDEFMDAALYAPGQGFYASGGVAGRRGGDFITSPEVGPLFGTIIAARLDTIWRGLGEPEEFFVAEVAAGIGTLARTVLAAKPACGDALRYTLVEISEPMRQNHDDLIKRGCVSAVEIPPTGADVILANELLDNLPTRILERTGPADAFGSWREVMVDTSAAIEPGDTPTFATAECPDPTAMDPTAMDPTAMDPTAIGLAIPDEEHIAPGSRIPYAEQAAAWVRHALDRTRHTLIVFDYGADTHELAARGQSTWLRAYRGHERLENPLANAGSADITVDVPFDQLPTPTIRTIQADWLQKNGLAQVLEAAKTTWETRASIGDLAAIKARSALTEADALTDPAGLGAFVVEEWEK